MYYHSECLFNRPHPFSSLSSFFSLFSFFIFFSFFQSHCFFLFVAHQILSYFQHYFFGFFFFLINSRLHHISSPLLLLFLYSFLPPSPYFLEPLVHEFGNQITGIKRGIRSYIESWKGIKEGETFFHFFFVSSAEAWGSQIVLKIKNTVPLPHHNFAIYIQWIHPIYFYFSFPPVLCGSALSTNVLNVTQYYYDVVRSVYSMWHTPCGMEETWLYFFVFVLRGFYNII